MTYSRDPFNPRPIEETSILDAQAAPSQSRQVFPNQTPNYQQGFAKPAVSHAFVGAEEKRGSGAAVAILALLLALATVAAGALAYMYSKASQRAGAQPTTITATVTQTVTEKVTEKVTTTVGADPRGVQPGIPALPTAMNKDMDSLKKDLEDLSKKLKDQSNGFKTNPGSGAGNGNGMGMEDLNSFFDQIFGGQTSRRG